MLKLSLCRGKTTNRPPPDSEATNVSSQTFHTLSISETFFFFFFLFFWGGGEVEYHLVAVSMAEKGIDTVEESAMFPGEALIASWRKPGLQQY